MRLVRRLLKWFGILVVLGAAGLTAAYFVMCAPADRRAYFAVRSEWEAA
jgi:hypothetical protein